MSRNSPQVNPSAVQAGGKLSVFEKYLTVWVFLCIIGGIILGRLLPGFFWGDCFPVWQLHLIP
jgi:ACR3 family arsenite transporter